MQITDTIADILTRIRNAKPAKHATVDVPASNVKKAITQILLDEGYIKSLSGSGRRQAGHYQNYIEIYRQQGSGYHRSSQSFQAGSADLFQLCRYAEGKKGSGYCDRFYF